jgi:hypothetical protein
MNEREIIYLISQKDREGEWNKLVKSQEQWWYSPEEALKFFNKQEKWFQDCNAIFEVEIDINNVQKIHDPYRNLNYAKPNKFI